ncbi:MAG: hypothetical protein ACREAU_00790 [Nitrosopumilaceae archaeon]
MKAIHTTLGEKIKLRDLDDSLFYVEPGNTSMVPARVYISNRLAYQDILGPRIRIWEGPFDENFNINETYPIFLAKELVDPHAIQDRRPILWREICRFVENNLEVLITQWNDIDYAQDSCYYLDKLKENAM